MHDQLHIWKYLGVRIFQQCVYCLSGTTIFLIYINETVSLEMLWVMIKVCKAQNFLPQLNHLVCYVAT